MAVYTALDKGALDELIEDYGLVKRDGVARHPVGLGQHELPARDAAREAPAAHRRGEGRARREARARPAALPPQARLPVPAAARRSEGPLLPRVGGKCVSLYRYIDGRVVAVERLTHRPARERRPACSPTSTPLGKSYKKGIDNRFSFERIADALRRGARPAAVVLQAHRPHARRRGRTTCRTTSSTKLPKGIIHGDLFHDNLLFKGDKLVAMLDFEAACRGQVRLRPRHRRERALLRRRAVRAEALRGADRRLRVAARRCRSPSGTRSRTSSASRRCASRSPGCATSSSIRSTSSARVDKDFREFYERLRILRRERDGGMEGLLMAMATGYDYRKYQKVKALEKKGSK